MCNEVSGKGSLPDDIMILPYYLQDVPHKDLTLILNQGKMWCRNACIHDKCLEMKIMEWKNEHVLKKKDP